MMVHSSCSCVPASAKWTRGCVRRLLGPLLIAFAGPASAQIYSDLTPGIQLIPEKPLYFAGDEVRVLLTVTNLGPDAAPSAVVAMNTFEFGTPLAAQVGIFPTPAIAPCFWDQVTLDPGLGGVGTIRPFVYFPAIQANTSLTCEVSLLVATHPRGSYLIGGQVVPTGPTVDLNASNNTIQRGMTFGKASKGAVRVPSANWLGLTVLAFFTVGAVGCLRRQG